MTQLQVMLDDVRLARQSKHVLSAPPLQPSLRQTRSRLGVEPRCACQSAASDRQLPLRVQCRSAAVLDQAPTSVLSRIPALPFVKLAGQEDMKLALLLNVVDSSIGGVLIMGDRGTGKSVAVRALVDLLPEIQVVPGDPFSSSPTNTSLMGPDALERFQTGEQLPSGTSPTPLVELPLGATEDRICGTIDIERALQDGVKAFEPGLLAKANRGILYVDEVNLLDDGLVDVVLDSSASGINTVEREGISIQHPAKFIMIGSGNPQEGELRPQLLDRFGLSVQVATMQDTKIRTQMVLDRLAYDADPDALCAAAAAEEGALRMRLVEAAERVHRVHIPRELRLTVSEICSLLDIDGIRGDITVNRAAAAYAAFQGRDAVELADVQRVLSMCLNHRMRKDPLSNIDNGTKVALAYQRITDPERAKKEAAKRKEAEAAAKKQAAEAAAPKKKGGAWGGLPSR